MMQLSKLGGVAFVMCACLSLPAMAYVGPGPGLSMIGSLFALVGSVFAALFMVVFWPVRVYYKRWKRRKAGGTAEPKKSENS